jgi:GNAT superfamily N-acetyltransferase
MNSLTDISIEKVNSFYPELTPVIDKLAKQIGENYEGVTADVVEHIITSDITHLILAKDVSTGESIGMITLVMYRIPYKTKGWLEDLVVDESYRGKGIATLLIEKAIEVAKENHLKKLDFTSKPQRESANNLYAKLGFEKHETNVYRLSL